MTIQLNQPAPDFTLFNTEKKEVSLSDYRGKNVVLLFFPLAFTGVCTTELCNVRDNIAVYNDANAEILAISVDSVFTLEKFKNEQNINFNLLSDFNKEVAQLYGAYYDNFVLGMKGVAKRAAFLIDKEGRVQYNEVLEDAGKVPDFDSIQRVLKSLT